MKVLLLVCFHWYLYLLLFLIHRLGEVKTEETFPSNYPYYWNWSLKTHTFEKGYLHLPVDSRSLQTDFQLSSIHRKFEESSEANQDEIILDIFHKMKNGYFIDLAANHWKSASNTFSLEYYKNWKGICIEADPRYYEGLLANRKCILFINPVGQSDGEKVSFHVHKISGWSGIIGNEFDNTLSNQEGEDLQLTTVTLTTILDFIQAPSIIHYLSLDIEGAEYYAMKGVNFDRYTIYTMTIERPKQKLHYLLASKGYLFVRQLSDFGECLYIHHSLPNFEKVWKEYHDSDDDVIIEWKNHRHDYILDPKWDGNITTYRTKGEVLYEKHKE